MASKMLAQLSGQVREVTEMLIQVSYEDDRYDYVKDFMLDALIRSGSIAKFRRSSGWVQVGVDPIRKPQPESRYSGAERRAGNA